MSTERIRNFSIIAHIDHGKSTLADRFLLKTGAITARQFQAQHLDSMEHALGINPADVLRASGKTGLGVDEIIQAIIARIPPPQGDPQAPLRALVYNSHFDTYKGVVVYVRVKEGTLRKGQRIRLMRGGTEHEVTEIGQFRPAPTPCTELGSGQVGYFMAQIKNITDVNIGDTVTDASSPAAEPLPGYKEPKPKVFSGLSPTNNIDFESLREALPKLPLNGRS